MNNANSDGVTADRQRVYHSSLAQVAALAIGLLCLWFISHPYIGLWHDARLYALQALTHLYPESYRNDLFVLYGSQDEFTIFSRIHAQFIAWFGLSTATITLLVAGYALWITSAAYLARGLTQGRTLWLALALVFTLPGDYGGFDLFSHGESFLTPRLFAEALTLLAFALMLQQRFFLSLVILFGAALLHPLVAATGFAFSYLYTVRWTKAWILFTGLCLTSVVVLAVSSVTPFNRLMQTMSGDWLDIVIHRDTPAFVSQWRSVDFNTRVLDATLLLGGLSIASRVQRRVFITALAAGVIGITVSLIGADWLQNVFVIQVQTWRIWWITNWFAYLAFAVLAVRLWPHSEIGRILLLTYVAAWLALDYSGAWLAILATVFVYFHVRSDGLHVQTPWIRRLLYLPFIVTLTFWLSNGLDTFTSIFVIAEKQLFPHATSQFFRLTDYTAYLLIFILLGSLITSKPRIAPMATGILCLFFATVLFNWDQRGSWTKLVESGPYANGNSYFKEPIPETATVYFADDLKAVWFLLGRSSYVSLGQGAGVLFSRDTALAYQNRIDHLLNLNVKDSRSPWLSIPYKGDLSKPANVEGLINLCTDDAVDYVVLTTEFEDYVLETNTVRHTYCPNYLASIALAGFPIKRS